MTHHNDELDRAPAPSSNNLQHQPERQLGPAYWAASTICVLSAGLCLYWRATEGHSLRGFIALAVTGLAALSIHRIATDCKES